MSTKAIREYDGKAILGYWLKHATPIVSYEEVSDKPVAESTFLAQIIFDSPHTYSSDAYTAHITHVLDEAESIYPWLLNTRHLVAKPDQLIKRRGKLGLVCLKKNWKDTRNWIERFAGKEQKVGNISDVLNTFLCEPFVPHSNESEYYLSIMSAREGDLIMFTHQGGIDVGDVEVKARKILIPISLEDFPSRETLEEALLKEVPTCVKEPLIRFIIRLYTVFVTCHFTYLEINPLVVEKKGENVEIYYLDLAAKLDQTAEYVAGAKWAIARTPHALNISNCQVSDKVNVDQGPPIVFPAPFGREMTKEERYIAELDSKTGASLKLTILNPNGRIWTLVAGGGASVVFADAIIDLGYADQLANYGEYSGAPTETQTYEYSRTIFDLMTRGPLHPEGKYLFIGGAIANFTNVATTFKGVVRAMKDYASAFHAHKVQIWVRRAGPNYQEGLKAIKAAGEELSLPLKVFGPETHISEIVYFALGEKPVKPTIAINSKNDMYINL
ncbi:hypothetical protein T552_01723 [Pneumocystis carinii B80]|uniref:ATP citrate synthase n=1 Tax=Pneumocystis carinii (strain B80) TaxID=1408658 RepID=A0A0W4ZJC3_PNEC8|nr:hypothetical protein T552_01723 [Pneumocystis carinii B80]KTW28462.1 hypothetical protein T552_01723 [Pneumocystis carinii B80]